MLLLIKYLMLPLNLVKSAIGTEILAELKTGETYNGIL